MGCNQVATIPYVWSLEVFRNTTRKLFQKCITQPFSKCKKSGKFKFSLRLLHKVPLRCHFSKIQTITNLRNAKIYHESKFCKILSINKTTFPSRYAFEPKVCTELLGKKGVLKKIRDYRPSLIAVHASRAPHSHRPLIQINRSRSDVISLFVF